MSNKMVGVEDHRFEAKARCASNVDVVRTCATFEDPDDLEACARDVAELFGGGVARAKNGFALDAAAADAQLHYRALLLTLGELARRSDVVELWERYCELPPEHPEVPWELWRSQARDAAAHLRDPARGKEKRKAGSRATGLRLRLLRPSSSSPERAAPRPGRA